MNTHRPTLITTLSTMHQSHPNAIRMLVLLVHIASSGKQEAKLHERVDKAVYNDLVELDMALLIPDPPSPLEMFNLIEVALNRTNKFVSRAGLYYGAIEPLRHLIGSLPSIVVDR